MKFSKDKLNVLKEIYLILMMQKFWNTNGYKIHYCITSLDMPEMELHRTSSLSRRNRKFDVHLNEALIIAG